MKRNKKKRAFIEIFSLFKKKLKLIKLLSEKKKSEDKRNEEQMK
jgi:hypothetical protein